MVFGGDFARRNPNSQSFGASVHEYRCVDRTSAALGDHAAEDRLELAGQ